jgi:HupE / UreJ protein
MSPAKHQDHCPFQRESTFTSAFRNLARQLRRHPLISPRVASTRAYLFFGSKLLYAHFPGKEVWIAGFFGLIHGLAFAATLDRLALGRWERVAGILAFNLGIETMQMLVVALILPSLMLLSRTRAYPVFRIGGAVFAGAASLGWIMERLLSFDNPVDAIMNTFARHSLGIAGALLLVSLACRKPFAAHTRHNGLSGLNESSDIQ